MKDVTQKKFTLIKLLLNIIFLLITSIYIYVKKGSYMYIKWKRKWKLN